MLGSKVFVKKDCFDWKLLWPKVEMSPSVGKLQSNFMAKGDSIERGIKAKGAWNGGRWYRIGGSQILLEGIFRLELIVGKVDAFPDLGTGDCSDGRLIKLACFFCLVGLVVGYC